MSANTTTRGVVIKKSIADSPDFSPVIALKPRDYVEPHVTSESGNSSWHL